MSYFLFITTDYKPNSGGIAAYLDNLARGLESLGNETMVLVVLPPEDTARIAFLQNYPHRVQAFPAVYDVKPTNWLGRKFVSVLEIIRCQWPSARNIVNRVPYFRASFDSSLRLNELIKQEKPTTIVLGHLDMNFYPLVLRLLESGLSYGVIAHDCEVYRCGRPNDTVRRGMVLKGASWIAANSRHTRALLKMWGLSNEKVMVVHPPLSAEAIRQSSHPSAGTGDGTYELVTVCRLVRTKGVDITLQALKSMEKKRIPFRYTIVGDGPDRQEFEALAGELSLGDKVRFMGHVEEDEKWALLRRSDVFVMPSRVNVRDSHEGFGLAFIEAAAVGVPAIGSMAGGIPEAVLHGETGLLVAPESPESLADALIWMYENPEKREEMGRVGMKRAIGQFAPEVIARQFEREISERACWSCASVEG